MTDQPDRLDQETPHHAEQAQVVPLRDVAAVASPGQWARDIAATYRRIAEGETWEPRRNANFAEAHKYEGIANAMDRSNA